MVNFKGGFAFNNEAAKVEVEQAPDGTLISCVNPVTGESLGGSNNYKETYSGTMAAPFNPDWLESDFILLCDAVSKGNASIIIDIDASASSMGHLVTACLGVVVGEQGEDSFILAQICDAVNRNGMTASWEGRGVITVAGVLLNGNYSDVKIAAENFPTVTTIYYHHMPE